MTTFCKKIMNSDYTGVRTAMQFDTASKNNIYK